MSEAATLVCPFDGTELKFQNWDYFCPECGHEFEDGAGVMKKRDYEALSNYPKLYAAARLMFDDMVALKLPVPEEAARIFGK